MIAATLRKLADALDPPEAPGLVEALRTLGAAALLKAGGSAEALFEAADRIEDLEQENTDLRALVGYWQDNHSAELWNEARAYAERWEDEMVRAKSALRVDHEKRMIDAWLKTPAGWEKSVETYGVQGRQRVKYTKALGEVSAEVYQDSYRNEALNRAAWQARGGTEKLHGYSGKTSDAVAQADKAFNALLSAERARKEALEEGLKGALTPSPRSG